MAEQVRVVQHEDRLPWLETVEPDEPDRPANGRLILLVVGALVLLAAIMFGINRFRHQDAAAEGGLIEAEAGAYKVRPGDPGGLKVKGEGTSAVATSAGKTGSGAIDLRAVPEAPVDGRRVQPAAAEGGAGGRNVVATVPVSGGRLTAKPPVAAGGGAATGRPAGGSMVQLGAYPSEAVANAKWAGFAKRFGYLAAMEKVVQPVASQGQTLYRLRVNAGGASQAAELCGRLKVAGESCFVAS